LPEGPGGTCGRSQNTTPPSPEPSTIESKNTEFAGEAVEVATARLKRLEARVKEAATTGRHAPLIAALQSLRGVGVITAVTLARRTAAPSRAGLIALLGKWQKDLASGKVKPPRTVK
jgi:transposase